ncbi:unnamed protein product, partial [Ixodes persulcatus]
LLIGSNFDTRGPKAGTAFDYDLQKEPAVTPWTGLGADMTCFVRLRFLVLQVSPSYYDTSYHSRKRYLSVPCPSTIANVCIHVICESSLFQCAVQGYVIKLLLVLSGDVESNPGPFTTQQAEQLLKAISILPKLEKCQDSLLTELTTIKQNQLTVNTKLDALTGKITALETEMASFGTVKVEIQTIKDVTSELAKQVDHLSVLQDDLENRSRRCNLIFYGIKDDQNETWSQAQSKVMETCEAKLGTKLSASDIERSHRLGRFRSDKLRPIIVNFLSFKTKQHILSLGFKLKDSGIAISEDFSEKVRYERKQLLQFGKSQGERFKLHFNRLIIGDTTF